jgi:hypothetical protein
VGLGFVTEGAYLELLAGFLEEYLEPLLIVGFLLIKLNNDRAALEYLELLTGLGGLGWLFLGAYLDWLFLGVYLVRLFLGGGGSFVYQLGLGGLVRLFLGGGSSFVYQLGLRGLGWLFPVLCITFISSFIIRMTLSALPEFPPTLFLVYL